MPIATRGVSVTVTDALQAHVFDRVAEPLVKDVILKGEDESLRILFLVSTHNGLSQRAWIALTDLGHKVTVAVVASAAAMERAVRDHDPQLIVCPFLKQMIPDSIWSRRRCLVVHPGPRGDRGPSSLDWAIELDESDWGVTVLQANGEPDAGDIWATRDFAMRGAGKSSLYRHEVRHAAIGALVEAIGRMQCGDGPSPQKRASLGRAVTGRARPLMTQSVRSIDWGADGTDAVVRKIRAGEGHPGVLDRVDDTEFHLFGAHPEPALRGQPGKIIARRTGAICRATVDGAIWITQLRPGDTAAERYFKLPATCALSLAGVELDVPEIPVSIDVCPHSDGTYREIAYVESAGVGYLRFDFYNGAMSTDQCVRLREAYAYARSRETRVIVLMGGSDYFSNGIHLNTIEAAEDPGAESWRNLNAIDDLVRDIVETDSHMVMSALGGDAGAGGVPLALAADYVVAREDVVLNPYYQHMGGLYGSEYWTYLLPRRVGPAATARLTGPPFRPVGTTQAVRIGLLDAAFGANLDEFRACTARLAERIAHDGLYRARILDKRRGRALHERVKPLQAYRDQELARCHQCFFGADETYHEARRRFVYKLGDAGGAFGNSIRPRVIHGVPMTYGPGRVA
jgi:putative two-component system protein, hydrogenase maturation factor HypX/HoxX